MPCARLSCRTEDEADANHITQGFRVGAYATPADQRTRAKETTPHKTHEKPPGLREVVARGSAICRLARAELHLNPSGGPGALQKPVAAT